MIVSESAKTLEIKKKSQEPKAQNAMGRPRAAPYFFQIGREMKKPARPFVSRIFWLLRVFFTPKMPISFSDMLPAAA